MKIILSIAVLALAGCVDQQAANDRWADMKTDLSFVQQYQRYTCGHQMPRCHPREGYSKDSGDRRPQASVSKNSAQPVKSPSPIPSQATEQVNRQIYELSQKIATLEEALKTNAATTNQNETLLVQQIVALKNQLAQLQTGAPMAALTPAPRQETASGLRIPGND
jgi:hypothetical protein